MNDAIVIVGAARTPMGSFQGDFSALAAHDLGGVAIKAAVERAGIDPAAVDEVLFGNCLMAGQGQAPARQAAFKGGLPISAGAVTLSKMCGSGMRAAMFGHDMLLAGSVDVVVAGGMESMTNAPYLLPKARDGFRLGHRGALGEIGGRAVQLQRHHLNLGAMQLGEVLLDALALFRGFRADVKRRTRGRFADFLRMLDRLREYLGIVSGSARFARPAARRRIQ
jgi:acetyl-CoA acetyltransferase